MWLPSICSGLLFLKIMSRNVYAWMQAEPDLQISRQSFIAGSSICHPQLENSSSNDTVAYSDLTCPGPLPPKTAQPPACMTQGVAFFSAEALSRALLPVAVIGRFVLTNQKLSTQTESTIYKLFRSPLGELLNNSHFHWVSSTTNV